MCRGIYKIKAAIDAAITRWVWNWCRSNKKIKSIPVTGFLPLRCEKAAHTGSMTTKNPIRPLAPSVSSTPGGDSSLPKNSTGSFTRPASITSPNFRKQPHPSLRAIARLLGRQAGQFFAQNRFKGLGGVELYRLRMEGQAIQKLNDGVIQLSDAASLNKNRKNSIKTIY